MPLQYGPTGRAEAKVQSMVVSYLVNEGWSITSVADTASRARGIDIVASKEGQVIGVEVKGYPGREYADPGRKGEQNRHTRVPGPEPTSRRPC